MRAEALGGGFADAPREAARAFREVMEAMARPGSIREVAGAVPPAPLSVAAGVMVLVLCDPTTPVHLAGAADCTAVRDWVRFHTGAPLCGPGEAAFAVGVWEEMPPFGAFAQGEPAFPDRSATLIAEVARLAPEGARLRGPGIAGEAALSLPDPVPFRANRLLFPLGVDVILTCGARLAALPRSVEVL